MQPTSCRAMGPYFNYFLVNWMIWMIPMPMPMPICRGDGYLMADMWCQFLQAGIKKILNLISFWALALTNYWILICTGVRQALERFRQSLKGEHIMHTSLFQLPFGFLLPLLMLRSRVKPSIHFLRVQIFVSEVLCFYKLFEKVPYCVIAVNEISIYLPFTCKNPSHQFQFQAVLMCGKLTV